jgi:S1/P1 Nuclease
MHKKFSRNVLLEVVATLLLLTLAPSAQAWGPTGHRVVAEIAQRHLTPVAQAKVSSLLGGRTLADVANWPDELRSDPRFDKYKPLHFATVKDGLKSYRDAEKARCGDLIVAIDAFTAFLRTGSRESLYSVKALDDKSDGTTKSACNPAETKPLSPDQALSFLVHLMGDLHQPLHVGGTDLGGNKVDVNWMDRWKSNLHSTWDDEMVDYERFDYVQYARFLDRATEADAARWMSGDTISWADEAVAMRSKLYVFPDDAGKPATPKPVPGKPATAKPVVHKISYGYTGAQRYRMREQLLKGGLRLAAVLNAIFKEE